MDERKIGGKATAERTHNHHTKGRLMFSWGKKKLDPRQTQTRQPVIQWGEEEIPRYPPFMQGLPVVPPEKLLESQKELLDRIANTSVATPEIFQRHFLPAALRFAAFAHLLPASQSHHHRGAGGLLRHAVEVGLWALQSADQVLLQSATSPSHRREMEPRWQLAVFLAAMCHDAGKPVTDLTVTNKDRTEIWSPITEGLYSWARRRGVNAYYLDWRSGRSRQHTALSSLIADRIIGLESLAWIAEGNTDLVVWLMESLACNPSPANLIHDLVTKADQTSVERDLKTLGVAMAGYDIGVPVERHLTDVMRKFVKDGLWLVNQPGARVWNIDGNIYLVWPAAGEELARQIREDGIPGIPRTPEGILEMLVERQIAFVREDASPDGRYWKIAPAVLAVKIPDIKLQAIRLRDDAMVSATPIPVTEGKLVSAAAISGQPQPSALNTPEIDSQRTAQLAGGSGCNAPEVDLAATVPPHEATESKPDQLFSDTQTATHKGADGDRRAVSGETNNIVVQQANTATPHPPAPLSATKSKQNRDSGTKIQATGNQPIKLDGAVGEAIKALAHDVRTGDKAMGLDVVLDEDGQACLKWPDAFSGYGLTPKAILDELSARDWLVTDAATPDKKTTRAEFKDGTYNAVRLTIDVSAIFAGKAEKVSKEGPKQTQATPVRHEKPRSGKKPQPSPKTSGTPSQVASLPHVPVQAPAQGNNSKTDTQAGLADDNHSDISPIEDDAPSMDAIIAALSSLSAAPTQDGFCLVHRKDALNVFGKHKLNIRSHGQLEALCRMDPKRFVLNGSSFRFKL